MRRLGRKGMTLLELMIVVEIMGVLSMMSLHRYQDFTTKVRRLQAKIFMKRVYNSIIGYYNEFGFYPCDVDRGIPPPLTMGVGFSSKVSGVMLEDRGVSNNNLWLDEWPRGPEPWKSRYDYEAWYQTSTVTRFRKCQVIITYMGENGERDGGNNWGSNECNMCLNKDGQFIYHGDDIYLSVASNAVAGPDCPQGAMQYENGVYTIGNFNPNAYP